MEESKRLICPITCELMEDPVLDAKGNCYERTAIQQWLQDHDTSPVNNEVLPDKKLLASKPMKSEVIQFREDKIKEGLKIFPKLMTKEHFPLAQRLYDFMDKYNKVLKNNFSIKIIETLLSPEVIPKLIKDTPDAYE